MKSYGACPQFPHTKEGQVPEPYDPSLTADSVDLLHMIVDSASEDLSMVLNKLIPVPDARLHAAALMVDAALAHLRTAASELDAFVKAADAAE